MAETLRSLSPNKKKVKPSKLATALMAKTTFKSECKRAFSFITGCQPVRYIETAHYINFF